MKRWFFLTLIYILGCVGVNGFRVKIPDLRCIQCNMNGDNPSECNGEAGKTFKLCDPAGSRIKTYFGCVTITGKDSKGNHAVTKGCVADCNSICFASVNNMERPTHGQCITMDAEKTEQLKYCTEHGQSRTKMLRPKHAVMDKICYCEEQECNGPTEADRSGSGHAGDTALQPPRIRCFAIAVISFLIATLF